jgi:hypothetical protein
LTNLLSLFFFKTVSASSVKSGATIISKNISFNFVASFSSTVELKITIPPKAETESQDNAFKYES